MTHTMNIAEARSKFTRSSKEFKRRPDLGAIEITSKGHPVMAVLSWDMYEGLMETLEIIGDADLLASLRTSVRELENGKTIPWNTVKAKLNL